MNTLTLTVHANKDGIYTAKGTIKQILNKFKNIQTPKMPVDKIALCDLSYNNKRLIYANAKGISGTYDDNTNEFLQREITLYFN